MGEPAFEYSSVNDYKLSRPNLLSVYIDDQYRYLKTKYPQTSDGDIKRFLNTVVKERLKIPDARLLYHKSYGNTEELVIPLNKYLDMIQNNILSPYGAMFKPPSVQESVIRKILTKKIAARNVFKHRQLDAEALGDHVTAQIYKLLQASTKIFTNSIPGATGFSGSFLYDLPNYNATTSTARLAVMTGYSHTEKMIAGNLYITSYDDAVHYCIVMMKACPYGRVKAVIDKYGIKYPSIKQVVDYLCHGLKYYTKVAPIKGSLTEFIMAMQPVERAFIYYGYCFKNFAENNEDFVKGYMDNFFRSDVLIDASWNPAELLKVPEDIRSMAMSLNYDLINRQPELQEVLKVNPDGALKLIAVCKHMMNCIEDWKDIYQTFFRIDVKSPKTMYHPNMIRNVVLLSDTDSVIFTTQPITSWYAPKEHFTKRTDQANAFAVFLITQTLKHVFLKLSTDLGIEGDDRRKIIMKNEFYFPVFVRTSKGKHYVGGIKIQEGRILPNLKLDLKGVSFRGSDIPKTTSDFAKQFIIDTIVKLEQSPTIDMKDLIGPVSEYEMKVYKSLMLGEKMYLQPRQIKPSAEEYKKPESSAFFFYELWQEVFAEKLGDFILPNKGLEIPLIYPDVIRDSRWLDELRRYDRDVHDKMCGFLRRIDKPITRLIVPQTLASIPEIFLKIMNAREIVFKNGRPMYLFLQSFGITINDNKFSYLATDFYGQISEDTTIPLSVAVSD